MKGIRPFILCTDRKIVWENWKKSFLWLIKLFPLNLWIQTKYHVTTCNKKHWGTSWITRGIVASGMIFVIISILEEYTYLLARIIKELWKKLSHAFQFLFEGFSFLQLNTILWCFWCYQNISVSSSPHTCMQFENNIANFSYRFWKCKLKNKV